MAQIACDCGRLKDTRSQQCRTCHCRSVQLIASSAGVIVNCKPSEVRQMSGEESAWVGALVEGEGSISSGQVAVVSTDVETISTLLRFVGGGGVYPHQYNEDGKHLGKKIVWVWRLFRQASVRDLLRQISPWLTSKQDKALEAVS